MDRASAVTAIVQGGRARGLSDDQIRALVMRYDQRVQEKAGPLPAGATAGMLPQSTTTDTPQRSLRERMVSDFDARMQNGLAQTDYAKQHPVETAVKIGATVAVPGVISMASKAPGIVGAGVRMAAKALDNPLVGGGIGALDGYRRGGVEGALIEGAAGVAGSSRLAKLLNRLAPAPPVAPAGARLVSGTPTPTLESALNEALNEVRSAAPSVQSVTLRPSSPMGGGYTLPPEMPRAAAAQTPATATPRNELVREIFAREPNWRVTDAVPIDAIKRDVSRGGSILEAGESVPGLADRLAQLLKNPTPESLKDADLLSRALRQRQHIRARVK